MKLSKRGFKLFVKVFSGVLILIYLWMIFAMPVNMGSYLYLGFWGVGIFGFLNVLEIFAEKFPE